MKHLIILLFLVCGLIIVPNSAYTQSLDYSDLYITPETNSDFFGGYLGGDGDRADQNRWIDWSIGNSTPYTATRTDDMVFSTAVGNFMEADKWKERMRITKDGNVGIGILPAHRLDVDGDVRGNSRVAFGNDGEIGPSTYRDKIFDFSHTITDNVDTPLIGWEGFRSHITLDPVQNLTGPVYGLHATTAVAEGNDKDFYFINGQYLTAFHKGTGTVDFMGGALLGAETAWGMTNWQVGAWITSDIYRTGSITDNMGLVIETGHRGTGGTITNDYSLYIYTPSHDMPLTNHYGIYLEDQDLGTNNSYAIYSAGGKSYFAGNVGFGTTTPQSAIQVSGYAQLDLTSGVPPAADCDEALERGRMKVDDEAGLLYICVASGWVSK